MLQWFIVFLSDPDFLDSDLTRSLGPDPEKRNNEISVSQDLIRRDNAVYYVCAVCFSESGPAPVIVLITTLLRMTSNRKHRKRCERNKLDF